MGTAFIDFESKNNPRPVTTLRCSVVRAASPWTSNDYRNGHVRGERYGRNWRRRLFARELPKTPVFLVPYTRTNLWVYMLHGGETPSMKRSAIAGIFTRLANDVRASESAVISRHLYLKISCATVLLVDYIFLVPEGWMDCETET